jgi:hypothetical protein
LAYSPGLIVHVPPKYSKPYGITTLTTTLSQDEYRFETFWNIMGFNVCLTTLGMNRLDYHTGEIRNVRFILVGKPRIGKKPCRNFGTTILGYFTGTLPSMQH